MENMGLLIPDCSKTLRDRVTVHFLRGLLRVFSIQQDILVKVKAKSRKHPTRNSRGQWAE